MMLIRMVDEQEGCEWMNVSSGTGHPGRAVKWLCVCVLLFCVQVVPFSNSLPKRHFKTSDQ